MSLEVKHKTISGNSQYNTLEHSFASQGEYDDIQKINEITIDDSKMTPNWLNIKIQMLMMVNITSYHV